MAGDVEALGEELGLLADRVGDGGGELAREREVARHLTGKVLGRVEGVVDVPLELVDEGVGSDGDVELDEDAHVVVLVGVVGKVRVQGVLVDEDVRVEVLDLVGQRAGDALGERARLVQRQAKVLDELARKVIGREEALVQVPGEGVAKLDPVELDVEPHGHELLEPVCLGGAVGARDAQLLGAASARPLALGRVQHARLGGVGVAVAVAGVAVAEDGGRVDLALAPQGLIELDLSSLGAHRPLERGGVVAQGGGVQVIAREVLVEQQVAGRRPGQTRSGSSIFGGRVGCGVGGVLEARLNCRRGRRRGRRSRGRRRRRRGGSRQQGSGALLAGADGLAGRVGSLVEVGRQLVGEGRGRVADDGWDDVEAQHGRFGHGAHRAGVRGTGPSVGQGPTASLECQARQGGGGGGREGGGRGAAVSGANPATACTVSCRPVHGRDVTSACTGAVESKVHQPQTRAPLPTTALDGMHVQVPARAAGRDILDLDASLSLSLDSRNATRRNATGRTGQPVGRRTDTGGERDTWRHEGARKSKGGQGEGSGQDETQDNGDRARTRRRRSGGGGGGGGRDNWKAIRSRTKPEGFFGEGAGRG